MDYKKLYENQSERMDKLQDKYNSIKDELEYQEAKYGYLDDLIIELNQMQKEWAEIIEDMKKKQKEQEEIRSYMLKEKAYFDNQYKKLLKQAKKDLKI